MMGETILIGCKFLTVGHVVDGRVLGGFLNEVDDIRTSEQNDEAHKVTRYQFFLVLVYHLAHCSEVAPLTVQSGEEKISFHRCSCRFYRT